MEKKSLVTIYKIVLLVVLVYGVVNIVSSYIDRGIITCGLKDTAYGEISPLGRDLLRFRNSKFGYNVGFLYAITALLALILKKFFYLAFVLFAAIYQIYVFFVLPKTDYSKGYISIQDILMPVMISVILFLPFSKVKKKSM